MRTFFSGLSVYSGVGASVVQTRALNGHVSGTACVRSTFANYKANLNHPINALQFIGSSGHNELINIVLQGNAAGKYASQPLKASCASYAERLAPPALCLEP